MSTLLHEIGSYDACAASKLKKAGFQTDSEIQTLTLEDLHELFPGLEKLKLRNTIFKIIHKQMQIDPFLEKLGDVSQRDSLRGDVIKECLNRIKNIKEQLDEKQTVLKFHNDFPKDICKSLDSEKALQMEPGQLCLKEPERYEAGAASVEISTEVDFQTDSVVQILYREDLQELFPGPEYLKLRRTIFQIIHNQTPAHLLLEELKGFTQQNSFNDVPVARYLERIKNTKQQLDEMQIILEAHNNMRNDRSKSLDSGKEKGDDFSFIHSFSSWYIGLSQKTQGVVRFKVEVSGETFGADQQLLDEIKTPDLKWIEGEEHDITIVFCPVTSQVGTDAASAMRKVPDGDPAILVLMHYSQEPKHSSSTKVLSSNPNVVLEVNIFYHKKKKGLLKCRQNENAVIELKEELKKYSRPQRSGFNY
ncbi:uncharacterized protein LOC101160036 isoform X3 [Oryzias latipes]|uniref:uncharacterized protein LOC101160036 isoform X3 n=1 Tax=Oryzias latipes TaxID=8090 RepID=UPI0002A4C97B|nr:uncharacterized protein LOC101160036 isoform X3 [Oryzias latipes]